MFVCILAPGITASPCPAAFSPRVEEVDPDTAILDAAGLGRLIGPPEKIAARIREQAGAGARIGIAAGRDAAYFAARGFEGVTILRHGEEAARLAPLPVELLDPPPEILETLDCWGIRTFGELAALPEIGLAARMGQEGLRLHKLARGESVRPFRPARAGTVFEESLELEYPIELLEPLSFVLSRLLNGVCRRLEEHALAALELRLSLGLGGGAEHARALRLPVPMRNPIAFLKLFQLDLTSHPPPAPVKQVTLAAVPALPRPVQEGLFLPPSPEPEKLELTLARIAAVVGAEHVGSPQLVDTHRPGAFRMRKFGEGPAGKSARKGAAGAGEVNSPPPSEANLASRLGFRVFRPPLAAKVMPPMGMPLTVAAQAPGGRAIRGKVVAIAGPWRSSGDWWTPAPWARDDFDVALSDGALYRIYSEQATGRWFIEGQYD
jgi:protein ImuB